MNATSGSIYSGGIQNGINGADLDATTAGASDFGNLAAGTGGGDSGSQSASAATTNPSIAHSAILYLGVLVVILFTLHLMRGHKQTENKSELIPFNVYNLLTITLMAIIGISSAKIILTKYPITGLSSLISLS